jgi:DNA-binding NarL/FixJ family response regulator
MTDAGILPLVVADPRPTGVVIADGQPLVREGLRALLDSADGVTVVGQASDSGEAAALARELRPDVLLVDSALPGVGAPELARQLRSDPRVGGVHVVLLSPSDTDESILPALRAGISGALLKDGRLDQLADAVRAVARGEAALAPRIARLLMTELAAQPDVRGHAPEQLDELTAREREVVALVAAGLSNREIAEQLAVSPATAKTHVGRALYKLRARDRAQLVRLAYETGLVVARGAVATSGPAALAAA